MPSPARRTSATEYHVSIRGDDAAEGTALRPFRTIQRAADAMQAGDSCVVHEGTYRGIVKFVALTDHIGIIHEYLHRAPCRNIGGDDVKLHGHVLVCTKKFHCVIIVNDHWIELV